MNLLLDTTIQIDRITGSNERKRAIDEILKGNRLFCSTYVLGEYVSSLVKDFVTLYALFLMDRDIAETGKKISERIFGRSQARVHKIYANILELCDRNIDEIDDTFLLYVDLIQDQFYYNLQDMLDTTKCMRCKAEIKYEDGRPVFDSVSCTKKKEICDTALSGTA